jgi:predicted TIM-barrel fold metal-dependent hydrolase
MRAIDVHVHPPTRGLDAHACHYFRRDPQALPRSDEEFAALYTKHQVQALLIGWHPSTVRDGVRNDNDYVLRLARAHPEAFAGVLAAVDMRDDNSADRLERAAALAGNPDVAGFKFHPPDQGFYPSDRKHYELWEILAAAGKPVMFHAGFTVLGANQDGGDGIGLDYGRPIHLDTLARDFPRMKIVAAHPGWPWHEELLGVVTHKKNIVVDTSGYLAEQLPEIFQRALRGRLQDKALFGTDFPYVDLEAALVSLDKLGLKDEVKEKIILTNARRLFGLP